MMGRNMSCQAQQTPHSNILCGDEEHLEARLCARFTCSGKCKGQDTTSSLGLVSSTAGASCLCAGMVQPTPMRLQSCAPNSALSSSTSASPASLPSRLVQLLLEGRSGGPFAPAQPRLMFHK